MDVFTFSLSENNELVRTDNLPGINSGSKDYYSAAVSGLISGTTSAVAYLTVSWHPGSKYGVPMSVSGTNGTFTIGEFFSSIPGVMNEYVDYHIGVSVVGYIGDTRYTTNIVYIPIIKSNYSASTDAPSLTQNQYDAFVDEVSRYATAAANSAADAADASKMKLIRKITTTEAVSSLVISTDENGNAISLDKFCLILSLPEAVSVSTGGIVIQCNGTSTSHYAYYHAVAETVKHARFDGECMGDTTGADGAVRNWVINYALGSANSFGNSLKTSRYMSAVPTINKLTFKMALPSGAVLVLYGRTA